MDGAREYDVVVFGATGYTGQFVNEELYRLQNEGRQTLKWAAAGRDRSKLEACLKDSDIEGIDVIVANVRDQHSLEDMCSKTTVLINCVGPYVLYGEPVVKACISQKTNYVDITGENYFMESIAANYDEEARDAGIYIVSACGFDSIPNDLGALLLQRTFNGDLVCVDSYMVVSEGFRFNTGTWQSFLLSIHNHGKLRALRRQQNLPRLVTPYPVPPARRGIFYSRVANRWCVPFLGPDKNVLHRSLRYRQDNEGIDPFSFRLYFGQSSLCQTILMSLALILFLPLILTKCGLNLLLKFPGLFSGGAAASGGPTRKELEDITFTVTLQGTGYSEDADKTKPPDSKITVKVKGIDPGYGATSAMLVQSALCFIFEKESLPPSGGVYTPAVAFGNTNIIQNLENTGKVKFEVQPN